MEANLEIKENQEEYHVANTFPQIKQENVVPQENLYHTQNIFDKQELFETKILSNDQNQVNNNTQNSQIKQEEVKETSYTFDGMDNIFSNSNQSSSLKNTNLDLYIKNSQNIQTSNNKILFGEIKAENINSNNFQNTFEGPETNYTFDANIFKTNENTAQEVDYKFDADIFQKNPEIDYNDNANIYVNSENNNDNNLNINDYNYNLGENQNLISTELNQNITSTEENNLNLQNNYNTDYINTNSDNINYSETLPMEYLPEKVDQTNNNDNINLETNFDVDINKLTFGQQVLEPLLENNNLPDLVESQNTYQNYFTEEPKIENEINNQNFDNILTSNQNEVLMNINDNNVNNDNIINNTSQQKLSPFEGIQEAKTLILPNNESNDFNNNIDINNDINNIINNEQIEKEKEEKKEVEPIHEINKEEYHEEEINTNLNNNEENKNEIQLNNNNLDNIEQENKLENSKKENLPEEIKKEENKLVDISDEIKEIKDMPESPYEQRDVIFNKNNIKVIKIEDDETHFCSDLFSPLFKKIFG